MLNATASSVSLHNHREDANWLDIQDFIKLRSDRVPNVWNEECSEDVNVSIYSFKLNEICTVLNEPLFRLKLNDECIEDAKCADL